MNSGRRGATDNGRGRGNWNIVHGGAKRSGRAPEYGVWHKMLRRCRDPRVKDYKNYGARGITVCERWQHFAAFLADMGPRPSSAHTIERINNDAGYSPDNCIWATRQIQNNNRRARVKLFHCSRGHELADDNVYQRPDGKRGCKACRQKNMKDFYARHREERV